MKGTKKEKIICYSEFSGGGGTPCHPGPTGRPRSVRRQIGAWQSHYCNFHGKERARQGKQDQQARNWLIWTVWAVSGHRGHLGCLAPGRRVSGAGGRWSRVWEPNTGVVCSGALDWLVAFEEYARENCLSELVIPGRDCPSRVNKVPDNKASNSRK